jgi:hypothetical protein
MNYHEPQIGDMVELVGRSGSNGQYGLVFNMVSGDSNRAAPGWLDLMSEPVYCVLLSDGSVVTEWKESLQLLCHSNSV